jgi:hypothetical protein
MRYKAQIPDCQEVLVDTVQPPADDAEQQWIARYRKAIPDTAPLPQSRLVMVTMKASGIFKAAASFLHAILDSWVHSSTKFTPPLNFQVAPVKTFPTQKGVSEIRNCESIVRKKAG